MKTKLLLMFLGALVIVFSATSCRKDKEEEKPTEKSVLPKAFKVDIPSSISYAQSNKSLKSGEIRGEDVYQHLANCIFIGESASIIVEEIIFAIAYHNIDHAMTLAFQGDDDGKTKNLNVVENTTFEGANYQFGLTITDADSESNPDGGNALQVFWNTSPINGIAIFKPININVNTDTLYKDVMYRIDYSETGQNGYEKDMIVYIANWPKHITDDRFHMVNMKMFAGKNGNVVDVYGNTTHPEAYLFMSDTVGFDYAFVASGNYTENIAVAEVGLPPISLNSDVRATLLGTHSMYNEFYTDIRRYVLEVSNPELQPYQNETWFNDTLHSYTDPMLADVKAPGYFGSTGFIVGGTSPGTQYNTLETNIQNLTPYNPSTIENLLIEFKE